MLRLLKCLLVLAVYVCTARNLSLEKVRKKIDDYLINQQFNVRCHWGDISSAIEGFLKPTPILTEAFKIDNFTSSSATLVQV